MLKQLFFTAPVLLILAACQTTPPPTSDKGTTPAPQVEAAKPQTTSPPPKIETVEMIYAKDWSFDYELSLALRKAEHDLVLKTPENVTLNEIPEDLDKWLSRIKENGGTVKAKAIADETMKTRSLFGVLIDVILYLIGVAKEEATFSAVDDFNAILNYDKETGQVKSINFYRR